jgi:hypothetical protein
MRWATRAQPHVVRRLSGKAGHRGLPVELPTVELADYLFDYLGEDNEVDTTESDKQIAAWLETNLPTMYQADTQHRISAGSLPRPDPES